jgi:hypothetical protein
MSVTSLHDARERWEISDVRRHMSEPDKRRPAGAPHDTVVVTCPRGVWSVFATLGWLVPAVGSGVCVVLIGLGRLRPSAVGAVVGLVIVSAVLLTVERGLLLRVDHAFAGSLMWRRRTFGGWSLPIDLRQVNGVVALRARQHYSLTGVRPAGDGDRRRLGRRTLLSWFGENQGGRLADVGVVMVRLGQPRLYGVGYLTHLRQQLPPDVVISEEDRALLERLPRVRSRTER